VLAVSNFRECCACRYHSSRFYGVHDSETLRSNRSGIGVSISKNLGIVTIAAVDAAAHYRNIQVWCCALRPAQGLLHILVVSWPAAP
jgi:hypothetical protein